MSLTRYIKKRRQAKENDIYIESVTVGYQKNRQVFSDEKEAVLVSYLIRSSQIYYRLTPKDVQIHSERPGLHHSTDIFQDEDFLCSFVTYRPLNVTTDLDLENIAVSTQNTEINLDGTPSSPLLHSSTQNTTSAILKSIESVDAIAKCTSSIHGEPASSSSRDQTQIQCTFSPEIIRPYPKAGARNTKNKRKTRKSAILTNTPKKDALTLEQSSKKRQKTEQGGAGKRKKIAKKIGERCAKRKVLQDSDEESVEDSFCLVCCESFKQIRAGEEWVQCVICIKWSHVRCTKGNIDTYVCLNCDSDCSDQRMNSFT
nr:unnamed protein product [Callosobruchus analis]